METIEIDGPDITASRIALGTWAIGGWMWGGSDVRSAFHTVQAAIDHGVNLIDTAPIYGFGLAEEIVGRALAPNGRRKRMLIATKCGLERHNNEVRRNALPSRIREECDESLKRLRTLRLWASVCLALYVGFWLELDKSAASRCWARSPRAD